MMLLSLWLLCQDEISLTTSYRPGEGTAGIATFGGKTKLPDGSVLQLSLVRLGYTAGVMSTRLSRLETTPNQTILVEVRKGEFKHAFSVVACGEYRLRVSFKRRYQESQSVVQAMGKTLKEFETAHDLHLGTADQFVAGVRRSLQEADVFKKRIQGAVDELSTRDPAEVAGRFAGLKSELSTACARTSLLATLHAQIDTCSLFYNTLAFEGKAPRYSGGAGGNNPSGAHIDGEDQPGGAAPPAPNAPAPRRRGEVTVDLTHLERIACRESALVLAVLLAFLSEDAPALTKACEPLAALHESLLEQRPVYKSMSEGIERVLKMVLEWQKETDSARSDTARAEIGREARTLAENFQSLPR